MRTRHPLLYRLALAGCALALLVVVLGAFTRLSDAGLGCPDWPGCYGHLTWPSADHEIDAANARFPETPVDTSRTWPEMVHRYAASLLGLLIIGMVLATARPVPGTPRRLPRLLLGLVILQGMFGMWTVTLKLWPQVVTLHLLGGFATLSLLWLLVLRGSTRFLQAGAFGPSPPQILAVLGLFVLLGQIALGGWTSANYAALACPDLPTCQHQWLPPADFARGFDIGQHIGPNYLGGLLDGDARVAIHLTHRVGALVTCAVLLWLALRLWGSATILSRQMALLLLAALAVQVALGISNVLFTLPLPVAVAHNAGAALLLLVMLTINYGLFVTAPAHSPLPEAHHA